MKKLFLIIPLAIALLLSACSSGSGTQKESGGTTGETEGGTNGENKAATSKTPEGDIKFYPTYDPDYKTAGNEFFAFWFDIPNEWKAEDLSEDGSVYTIFPGKENIGIKIYGVMKNEPEEEYYASLAGKNGTVTDFTYRDGWIGKQIKISDGESYYVRVDGDSYLVFYFNSGGDNEWLNENKDKIDYIAMSARTTRESYGSGLDEKNYIALEDLQLGKVKLGMSYEELTDVMEVKPVKEEKEEYEGLNAKTLFYDDDTQIYIVDNTVYSMNVTSPDYETPRGLKVGDGTAKVKELYGEPANISDDGYWGYTYDGYELFTLLIKNGKVAEIQVDTGM